MNCPLLLTQSLKEVRQVFSKFDDDRDGVLSEKEAKSFITSWLKSAQPDITTEVLNDQTEEWFQKLDKNKDKKLAWQELAGILYFN